MASVAQEKYYDKMRLKETEVTVVHMVISCWTILSVEYYWNYRIMRTWERYLSQKESDLYED